MFDKEESIRNATARNNENKKEKKEKVSSKRRNQQRKYRAKDGKIK